jgi:hypothetical protein
VKSAAGLFFTALAGLEDQNDEQPVLAPGRIPASIGREVTWPPNAWQFHPDTLVAFQLPLAAKLLKVPASLPGLTIEPENVVVTPVDGK